MEPSIINYHDKYLNISKSSHCTNLLNIYIQYTHNIQTNETHFVSKYFLLLYFTLSLPLKQIEMNITNSWMQRTKGNKTVERLNLLSIIHIIIIVKKNDRRTISKWYFYDGYLSNHNSSYSIYTHPRIHIVFVIFIEYCFVAWSRLYAFKFQ